MSTEGSRSADRVATAVLALLFSELIDDAALFPPGDAPMAEAVLAHLSHDSGPHSRYLGRFLCQVSKLDELRSTLSQDDDLRLGLIADTGLDGLKAAFDALADDDRFMLESAEIRHPGDRLAELEDALPYGVDAYVEIAPDAKQLLTTLAGRDRMHAKLRTGGTTAEAFPSPETVADFIVACADLGVSFKCTAGLHRAARHTDEATGFTHFGFLNILVASSQLLEGPVVVKELLTITDGARLGGYLKGLDVEEAARVRDQFHGFGSCSFTEPIDDLTALSLLPKEDR